MSWKIVSEELPPINKFVITKIDRGTIVTHEQRLKFDGKLWWHTDGKMYVYFIPTHWKFDSFND